MNIVVVDLGLLLYIVEGLTGEQTVCSQRQFLNAHSCTVWDNWQLPKALGQLLDPRPFPQVVHHSFYGLSPGLGEAPYVHVR